MLEPDPISIYLWLFSNWNEVAELVLANCQLHLDWPSHWLLNDPVVEAWPDEPDSEWEASEPEYEKVALANATDNDFEEQEEILIIPKSEGNEADDETIVRDAPSTEVKDGADA